MSNNRKLKKEIKCLKKSAKTAKHALKIAEKQVKSLEKKITKRDRQIVNLQQMINKTSEREQEKRPETSKFTAIMKKGVAKGQKEAWKKYSYLRGRYEFYLEQDHDKAFAREVANRDLVNEFGEEAGYSESELLEILS